MSDELGLDLERLLRQRGWLRALARGLVSEGEVDDLLQESWLAALSSRSRPRRSLRAWFAGLARNASRGVRRERRGAEPEWDALGDERPAAGELLAQAELQERLIAAVRALREPYRATVLLHYFEELSLEDVGRRMGVPSSTARTRLARALAELRERFEREQGGTAWALVVALARGGGAGIPTAVTEVVLMGTVAKLGVGVVVVGLGFAVWWRETSSEQRAPDRAEAPVRIAADSTPLAPVPDSAAAPSAEPVTMRAQAPVESEGAALPSAPTSIREPSGAPAVATSPLERRLEAVADTFLTEEPDLAGLMLLSTALADGASLVPDSLVTHESGSVSGKLDAGGNLKGTFVVSGREYSVEFSGWNTPAPFPRQLELGFTEEDGVVSSARMKAWSIPLKDPAHPIGGQQLIGWRVTLDADGAKVHRTSMLVTDPDELMKRLNGGSSPPSDHYSYGTGDVSGVEPRVMPSIMPDALEPWLTRLRALRPR